MMPTRIQRRRTKGWRRPEGAIYVGRPSYWGNPWAFDDLAFVFGPPPENEWWSLSSLDAARDFVIERYREWLEEPGITYGLTRRTEAVIELAYRDLMCWCPLDQPCHADVLLEIANGVAS